jgi:hypothetical protein
MVVQVIAFETKNDVLVWLGTYDYTHDHPLEIRLRGRSFPHARRRVRLNSEDNGCARVAQKELIAY